MTQPVRAASRARTRVRAGRAHCVHVTLAHAQSGCADGHAALGAGLARHKIAATGTLSMLTNGANVWKEGY